ncbi:TIGR01244 family sulfur transferase [Geminicoccaceae bacterium 1502E]|uniref:TIGR01244 family sulfur transferase n=1 Tax=Marinimicrococcus flavescens TaxID=3031815 RepID=A0AAP3UYK0_9PROT|nr:TIGR01244 family sulfur transferase [Marinimicrococcus flavescens]MDX6750554.1 TIGR01244 family sulfur transferase [Geminicoccaceae bacterium 1502E]
MDQQRFRRLSDDFYVAPQLAAEDFAAAAALGIKTVLNNRPDGEDPSQLQSDAAARAAAEAGLAYHYLPVPSGGMSLEHVEAERVAIEEAQGPFLAYCRSGTRSCHLWAFVKAGSRPVEEIVAAAAAAGYDLQPAAQTIRTLATRNAS